MRINQTLVNVASLLDSYSGMEDVLEQVIHQFLQDYPALILQIQKSVYHPDAKSLTIAAHSLRGMLSEVHSKECERLAIELENMGRAEVLTQAQDIFNNLQIKMKSLEAELKSITFKAA